MRRVQHLLRLGERRGNSNDSPMLSSYFFPLFSSSCLYHPLLLLLLHLHHLWVIWSQRWDGAFSRLFSSCFSTWEAFLNPSPHPIYLTFSYIFLPSSHMSTSGKGRPWSLWCLWVLRAPVAWGNLHIWCVHCHICRGHNDSCSFLNTECCSENTLTFWSSSALRLWRQRHEWWREYNVCQVPWRSEYDLASDGHLTALVLRHIPEMWSCRRPLWMPSWWKRSHSGRFPVRWVDFFTRYSQRYCTWVDKEIRNLKFSSCD